MSVLSVPSRKAVESYCLAMTAGKLIGHWLKYTDRPTTGVRSEETTPTGTFFFLRIDRGLDLTWSGDLTTEPASVAIDRVAMVAVANGLERFVTNYGHLTDTYVRWEADRVGARTVGEHQGRLQELVRKYGTFRPPQHHVDDPTPAVRFAVESKGGVLTSYFVPNGLGNRRGCLLRAILPNADPTSWFAEPVFQTDAEAEEAAYFSALYSEALSPRGLFPLDQAINATPTLLIPKREPVDLWHVSEPSPYQTPAAPVPRPIKAMPTRRAVSPIRWAPYVPQPFDYNLVLRLKAAARTSPAQAPPRVTAPPSVVTTSAAADGTSSTPLRPIAALPPLPRSTRKRTRSVCTLEDLELEARVKAIVVPELVQPAPQQFSPVVAAPAHRRRQRRL